MSHELGQAGCAAAVKLICAYVKSPRHEMKLNQEADVGWFSCGLPLIISSSFNNLFQDKFICTVHRSSFKKKSWKKSLEELVIKLRNYNLDMGSGAGTGIPRFPRFRFRQFDLPWFIILSYFPPLQYYRVTSIYAVFYLCGHNNSINACIEIYLSQSKKINCQLIVRLK